MAGRPDPGSEFTRRLAEFSALARETQPDHHAITAAAAALEAEFDMVVGALAERQALLERLAKIQQSITHRADLAETLDAICRGAAELLDESVAGIRLVGEDEPAWMQADDVHATIAAPVRERGRVAGSLVVASRKPGRRFSDYERAALTALAEHASFALTDARMVSDALHQAVHDALTGLPNRTLFADRVEHALAGAGRRGTRVAVLFCDLDHFKVVNDSLGHAAGDQLLVAVAARLRSALRATDTVARFGGDEFAILLEDVAEERDAIKVADEVSELLRAPFAIAARQHVVSASIGIALSGRGATSPDSLVRDADAAMYRAKLRGRAGYEVFDEAMRQRALVRLRVEHELRQAIQAEQLRLAFQPIVSLRDGRVTGAEALVRWQHPERGLLAPAEFIPVAEESGLVVPMGDWVLHEACREAAAWLQLRPYDAPLQVAVNLSPRQVAPQLVDTVASAITAAGLDPSQLALEITEGILLEDSEASRGTLKALRALGVSLVLDDFGTGYSSLSYLKRLPLDGLKIDRSFVDGLGTDADDSAIVSAVAGMAGSLGLTLIAEGVETPEQVRELQRLECANAQGFHFARPLDAAAFRALIAPTTMRAPCPRQPLPSIR